MIGIDDVRTAAVRLSGITNRTPLLSAQTLDALCGGPVVCKAENLQRTGSFKLRGAANHILALSPEERARGVIAASSGNHAQALAYAARHVGTRAVVVVPADAPDLKVAGAQVLGAEVLFYTRGRDDRDAIVADCAATHGLTVIPSANSPEVMAGGGTVAMELLEQDDTVDTLVVPVGGGGLAAGCAVAAKALNPAIRVIGVEPEHGHDTATSLHQGRRVTIPSPATIADGLTHTTPAPLPFEINRRLLDQLVTITDDQIARAMAACFTHLKVIIEPSGACALAAVTSGHIPPGSGRIGVVLSGGNIAWPAFRSLIGHTDEGSDSGMSGLHAGTGGRTHAS